MLYIIRHGQTDWNVYRKLQGHTDTTLNAQGKDMAESAAKECSDIHIDICYSSPLKRARETAEIILRGRNVPIINDDRLMEMGFGSYEGIQNSFDIPDCPINVLFFRPQDYIAPVGGGESLDELFERTGDFLEEKIYPELDKGKDILIVGHGAMNCSIVSQIRGYDRADFWKGMTDNCKLVRLI